MGLGKQDSRNTELEEKAFTHKSIQRVFSADGRGKDQLQNTSFDSKSFAEMMTSDNILANKMKKTQKRVSKVAQVHGMTYRAIIESKLKVSQFQ
jgi:hypothetical protein